MIGEHSGRSLSTAGGMNRSVTTQLASDGLVMLESLRKKKETEMQVRMLENRIRRLKDEENFIKIKEMSQKRQIEQILRIRRKAQEEKE